MWWRSIREILDVDPSLPVFWSRLERVIGRFTDSNFTDTENLVDGVDNAGQSVGEMAVGEMSEYGLRVSINGIDLNICKMMFFNTVNKFN